ncbi:DUF1002 domain-containing protein [Blautia sp.]|uniref:DUF1002 domain-containing protein n=1 Tax=Blautia glucerasea TaxID=536633 RepID=A0A6N2V5F1_9FIRM
MKKRNVIAALICSACLVAGSTVPAMADSSKVVTLGADLTQDQKNTMMRYFKADANQVQILTITNQDEREQLGDYIPLEQIGTRTLSCAYVKPTQSGGIKVRTANLNYVTGNMIANALSTAGVTNCEAVAACPYEVSGTGALTGVIMAYENASGQKLDSTKKDLATQEVVVTGNLSQQVGQDNATNIINQAKLQIIGENVQNADEIYNIVNNIAIENNISLSEDEMNTIVSLLQQIAQQSYDIEQMKNTLENIQQNLDKAENNGETQTETEDDGSEEDGEDITENVDTDALGEDIKESSTEDPTLQEETMGEGTEQAGDSGDTGIPEATEDGTALDGTAQDDGVVVPEEGSGEAVLDGTAQDDGVVAPEEGTEIPAEGEITEDPLNTDALTEEGKASFEKAQSFCKGEYEGDTAALQSVMGDTAAASVTIAPETGARLTEKVLEAYINVLKDGGLSFIPAETDPYMSAELNMVNTSLKTIFSIEADPAEDDLLYNETPETRQALYNDTLKFFETLYGENTEAAETSGDTAAEAPAETAETPEEAYTEEAYDAALEAIPEATEDVVY